jgi:hypothetical protein
MRIKETAAPNQRIFHIMGVIALIAVADLIFRSNPHSGMLARNYLLRPIGPLLAETLSHSWIQAHQGIFSVLLITLTLIYWYILANLLQVILSYVKEKIHKKNKLLIISFLIFLSFPYNVTGSDSDLSNNIFTTHVNITSTSNLTIAYVRHGIDFDRNSIYSSDELVSPEQLSMAAANHSKYMERIYPFSDGSVNIFSWIPQITGTTITIDASVETS